MTNHKERVSYPQDWTAYNLAKTKEKLMFMHLLEDLTHSVKFRQERGPGPPCLDFRQIIFCLGLAMYSGKSSRRAIGEIGLAEQLGFVTKIPHFNTLLNYLRHPSMTDILQKLITISAAPLKNIENDFTVDASGFSTSELYRWTSHKYGKKVKGRQWVKAHVMSGVRTNIITAIEVTEGEVADTTRFETLVKRTGEHFTMREVSADKAYCSRDNLAVVDDFGAIPYIPFRSNARRRRSGHAMYIWGKMFDLFHENLDEFNKHYHKRSNSETTFAMMKRKFSGRVRTKNIDSQINEVLCMALCHNICVLIQEAFELGLDVDFNHYAKQILAHENRC